MMTKLLIVELQIHPVVDLVVFQRDVVLQSAVKGGAILSRKSQLSSFKFTHLLKILTWNAFRRYYLENGVPLFQHNLIPPGSGLRRAWFPKAQVFKKVHI